LCAELQVTAQRDLLGDAMSLTTIMGIGNDVGEIDATASRKPRPVDESCEYRFQTSFPSRA
jgi:hypothetical protein